MTMKYSPMETILLKMIPRRKIKITTTALMESFYAVVPNRPFHSRAVIVGMMRNLMRKSDYNDEKWRLYKTKRSGPNDISFWKAPR